MKVTPIKTHALIPEKDENIQEILDRYLPSIAEGTILAVTSKIVSICEGRFVRMDEINKDDLINQEADLYIPKEENAFNITVTITNGMLAAGAGVDESNGDGYYILWPENPQKSANTIREYVTQRQGLKDFGVVITDSKTSPLRWGVTGVAIAYSGFKPLKDYVGSPDLFGRPFQFEKLSIMDSLASSAVLVMGEGAEQQPLAIIEDSPLVQFQDRNPNDEELKSLTITMDSDVYGSFLKNAKWRRGKKNSLT